jgi:hypothetical protein
MGSIRDSLTNVSNNNAQIGAQLTQTYDYVRDMIRACEQIVQKGFSATTHEKNLLDKVVNLLSKIHGTELEFRHHIKHLNKGRTVTPDIDNTKDPDLRIQDIAQKYEKIIEFKAVTSSDSGKITGNVKSQLTSAIAQLCQRKLSNPHTTLDDYKFKAFIEIRFQTLFSSMTSVIKFNQNKGFNPLSLDDLYEYFKEAISSSFMSKKLTIADLKKSMGNLGITSINSTDKTPRIKVEPGKNSTFDERYKGIFQIDFSILPNLDVDLVGTLQKISKIKMFVFIEMDSPNSSNTIYLHKTMAYKIGNISTDVHNKTNHYAVCTFPD